MREPIRPEVAEHFYKYSELRGSGSEKAALDVLNLIAKRYGVLRESEQRLLKEILSPYSLPVVPMVGLSPETYSKVTKRPSDSANSYLERLEKDSQDANRLADEALSSESAARREQAQELWRGVVQRVNDVLVQTAAILLAAGLVTVPVLFSGLLPRSPWLMGIAITAVGITGIGLLIGAIVRHTRRKPTTKELVADAEAINRILEQEKKKLKQVDTSQPHG